MTRNLSISKQLIGLLIGVAGVGLSAQGCKKSEQSPAPVPPVAHTPGSVKRPEKPVQQQITSSVNLNTASRNQFDFSSKKDPFKPYIVAKIVAVPLSKKIKRTSRLALPIHSFDVNQFKLIGIITGGKENQAMVTDPNGKGYVINVGMTIGKNEGRIMSITSSGVNVLEQFVDDNGRVRKEYIKINLPRKQ
jgi:type IV pilus assembly protein PilP